MFESRVNELSKSENHHLELLGGKGMSLARLRENGFDVPNGFIVNTSAYREFVEMNDLQHRILALAKPKVVDGRASFEAGSAEIRRLFSESRPSDSFDRTIIEAYKELGFVHSLAVRSSANAEDLPDLSFAGQQETYLNVKGETELLDAILKCWASLWTPQAISYRHQNDIDNAKTAMAVVVQVMVNADVAGILFTANPATGERAELIVNANYGLGESVVSGQVTPDTYIVDRKTRQVKEAMLGPKATKTVAAGSQGIKVEEVEPEKRAVHSMPDKMLSELASKALRVEALNEGVPQDIEWAVADGELHLLQSRPITNLPPQPIELVWEPPPPAKILYRRQIVENMPDPLCPLFDELYLTEGLQSGLTKGNPEAWSKMMDGPLFMSLHGYAYQRADWKNQPSVAFSDDQDDESVKQREKEFFAGVRKMREQMHLAPAVQELERSDMMMFFESLTADERITFKHAAREIDPASVAHALTMPDSDNPTYIANNKVANNERQIKAWREQAMPQLVNNANEWRAVDVETASDLKLLEGIRSLGIAEGFYWTGNTSHTFGVAKSTDDQLQCFLRENAPDHNFISGQFLSGFESYTMQANADLFELSKVIRAHTELYELVIVTPSNRLMAKLQKHPEAQPAVKAIDAYLEKYGHQGYSLDFIEPPQIEDPSGLFATLKSMVADENYDPARHAKIAADKKERSLAEIKEVLDGFRYWQFRYRLWFATKYYFIREESAFYFGYSWPVLRPMAFELGKRLVEAGTCARPDDVFFLVTKELQLAIDARRERRALPELGEYAQERRELREARKRHHPPGTIPPEASDIPSVKFKETQIVNDETSDTLRGFAVSPGTVTGPASVVLSAAEFDKMQPGSILVSPLTTPAWTQLFSHATGLVTDMGSILAHGSIVAREYGIPAVLGVGIGTVRIKHGQMLTIDGDAGTVLIHEEIQTND